MTDRVKLTKRLHKACCEPLNAINWVLDSNQADGGERAFLTAWRCGDFGDWGDYVDWVRKIQLGRSSLTEQQK